jgi:methylenetetrahydrofolate reductase (NADPH)
VVDAGKKSILGLEGVAGFHIIAIKWEEKVPEIVEGAGFYPRPKLN